MVVNDSASEHPRGRGTGSNPSSRFERLAYIPDPGETFNAAETLYFRDRSRSVLTDNDSPDLPLKRSLNPYKGCSHGCSYCYARPTHEYLGLSAGLDFESKIFVKEAAPELLRAELEKPSYKPAPIAFSGATDPYQPVEKSLRLTRRCLEILAVFHHPVSMITKSAMIERDADLLGELAKEDCAWATISLTTLDNDLQRRLEPRASTPRARLRAVRILADAGVPVSVNIAPVIPGLTDQEIPSILKAAAEAGARHAVWVLLRLPHGVKDLFAEWLDVHEPLKKEKVLSRLRQLHGGKLYDSEFGNRMRGQGPLSEQFEHMFALYSRRYGLNREPLSSNGDAFRRPKEQMELF